MKKLFKNIQNKCNEIAIRTKTALSAKKGEGYIDTAVKIIIGVVIGGLLLAGLYTLFNTVIIPNMNTEIGNMFNFTGNP